MKNYQSASVIARAIFLVAFAVVLGLAGQVVGAQNIDIYKEVMAKRETIVWKPAPASLIPEPVCSLLQVCGGNPDKFIALAPTTENGQRVARGLFLTKDAKKNDAVMMLDQGLDIYFFLLNQDGSLQKAAYRQAGGTSWLLMANSLAQPAFEKDKKIWHDRVAQLGGAPAASPAATKQ